MSWLQCSVCKLAWSTEMGVKGAPPPHDCGADAQIEQVSDQNDAGCLSPFPHEPHVWSFTTPKGRQARRQCDGNPSPLMNELHEQLASATETLRWIYHGHTDNIEDVRAVAARRLRALGVKL